MALYILLFNVKFFEVLFILILVYYGFKFLMRLVAPKLVEKAASKLFEDMKNREASNGRKTVQKGDVTIDYADKKPKQYKRADGDYIEFEEIDDKK